VPRRMILPVITKALHHIAFSYNLLTTWTTNATKAKAAAVTIAIPKNISNAILTPSTFLYFCYYHMDMALFFQLFIIIYPF